MLIEYKLEGYNLFVEIMAQIRRNVIYSVYQFQPKQAKANPPELVPATASAGAADSEFPEMGDGKPTEEPEMVTASKGSRKKGGNK